VCTKETITFIYNLIKKVLYNLIFFKLFILLNTFLCFLIFYYYYKSIFCENTYLVFLLLFVIYYIPKFFINLLTE
jgi:hypothetical protein